MAVIRGRLLGAWSMSRRHTRARRGTGLHGTRLAARQLSTSLRHAASGSAVAVSSLYIAS